MIGKIINSLPEGIKNLFFLDFENHNIIYWGIPVLTIILALTYFRKSRSTLSLVLRLISFSLIIIAISRPYISSTSIFETPGKIMLVDTSSSMTKEAISDCVQKGKNRFGSIRIFPFDDDLHAEVSAESINLDNRSSSLTNFEQSLLSFEKNHKRLDALLCSDGIETAGDLDNILPILKQSEIRISSVFPDARFLSANNVRLKSLQGPFTTEIGESVTFSGSVENPGENNFSSKVNFLLNSKAETSERSFEVEPGKEIRLSHTFNDLKPGLQKITVQVPNIPEEQLSRWINVRERPRLLIIHGAVNERNLTENLLKTLGFERDSLVIGRDSVPESLDNYTGIILNNVPRKQIPQNFLVSLKNHVENGKGLLILGGDKSYGLGGYGGSILDDLSPLSSVPPRAKVKRLPSAVVLVIDKSGSMNEQGRMMSARLASLSAIQSMRDEDFIGIIGFDQAPLSIMDITRVDKAKQEAEIKLRNLTARGGTNLLPALSLARLRLTKIEAGKKHIIILSDGIFPHSSNTFVREINNIKSAGITMSTIALGVDADAPFLKMLAQTGKGNFYQVLNPNTLPRIFLDELKVAMGEDTMKEESDFPVSIGPAGLISSSVKGFPILKGFVETKEKQRASLELVTQKGGERFPVFASWAYGKGSVFAFSSDLQGRWTAPWVRWPDITLFWEDIFRKLKGKDEKNEQETDFDLRYEVQGRKISLNLFIYEAKIAHSLDSLKAVFENPKTGKTESFVFSRREAGWFEGFFQIETPGDYFLDIELNNTRLPRLGLSISAFELGERSGLGLDYSTLNRLTTETGGNADISSIEQGDQRAREITESKSLAFLFVIAGIIILLLEVFLREKNNV
ncbi:MAG TPA: VWA domain-containing protein [Oligoflexia bacterium]|nr:VWA domain-containing protein [Oligoflexia bacterium]HMP48961.1 VWA domain-containing protein [Oligoflexia bacterium]